MLLKALRDIFSKIGILLGAAIVNFVVLTAAVSSCNSGMYSTGLMPRGLASNSAAPAWSSTTSSRSTRPAAVPEGSSRGYIEPLTSPGRVRFRET